MPGLGVKAVAPPAAGAARAAAARGRSRAPARAARQGAALRRARRSPPGKALDARRDLRQRRLGSRRRTPRRGRPRCSTQRTSRRSPRAKLAAMAADRRALAMVAGRPSAEPRCARSRSPARSISPASGAPAASSGRRRSRRIASAGTAPTTPSCDLFDADPPVAPATRRGGAGDVPPVNAPAAFLPLAESVVLHRDPDRFGLLYRLLWRLQVEPGLRADPLDPDWLRADEMAQAVRRDMHKMKAFVRFRTLADADDERGAPLHVAWFEPEHHIVEATAPFFARRFTAMRWAILTPGAQRPLGRRRLWLRPGRAPRRGAARRCRREALAHLLPEHLQPGAPEARRRCSGRCPSATGRTCRKRS